MKILSLNIITLITIELEEINMLSQLGKALKEVIMR